MSPFRPANRGLVVGLTAASLVLLIAYSKWLDLEHAQRSVEERTFITEELKKVRAVQQEGIVKREELFARIQHLEDQHAEVLRKLDALLARQ